MNVKRSNFLHFLHQRVQFSSTFEGLANFCWQSFRTQLAIFDIVLWSFRRALKLIAQQQAAKQENINWAFICVSIKRTPFVAVSENWSLRMSLSRPKALVVSLYCCAKKSCFIFKTCALRSFKPGTTIHPCKRAFQRTPAASMHDGFAGNVVHSERSSTGGKKIEIQLIQLTRISSQRMLTYMLALPYFGIAAQLWHNNRREE